MCLGSRLQVSVETLEDVVPINRKFTKPACHAACRRCEITGQGIPPHNGQGIFRRHRPLRDGAKVREDFEVRLRPKGLVVCPEPIVSTKYKTLPAQLRLVNNRLIRASTDVCIVTNKCIRPGVEGSNGPCL